MLDLYSCFRTLCEKPPGVVGGEAAMEFLKEVKAPNNPFGIKVSILRVKWRRERRS
jgi:hypothetical protein